MAQAERERGERTDGLSTAEQQELKKLRPETLQLKLERDVLSKAASRGFPPAACTPRERLVRRRDRHDPDALLRGFWFVRGSFDHQAQFPVAVISTEAAVAGELRANHRSICCGGVRSGLKLKTKTVHPTVSTPQPSLLQ